jgi:hypothetical protein
VSWIPAEQDFQGRCIGLELFLITSQTACQRRRKLLTGLKPEDSEREKWVAGPYDRSFVGFIRPINGTVSLIICLFPRNNPLTHYATKQVTSVEPHKLWRVSAHA